MRYALKRRWRSCAGYGLVVAAAIGACNYESFNLPPAPPKTYTIQQLGLLPGGTQSQANGGSATAIVGWGIVSGSSHHAAAFAGGQGIALKEPTGTTASEARGVNDAGVVVGFAQISGVRRAYWWPAASAAATPVALPNLGGTYSFARSVNQNGLILGSAQTDTGDTVIVIWTPDGMGGYTVARLDTAGGQDYDAAAISNRGVAAGNGTDNGFIWNASEGFEDVDVPAGGADTAGVDVNGMNNYGIIAGAYTDAVTGNDRSFIFTSTAGSIPLGPPPSPYTGVAAGGVTDSGMVAAVASGVDAGGNAISAVVVGSILDTANVWTVLPLLPGGTRASVSDNGVTACGVLVGYATKTTAATPRYAVAWVPQGCTIP